MKFAARLFALLVLSALASTARAQFVGDYALTPPTGMAYSSNTTLGDWNFTTITNGPGGGSIDTTNAPDSFVLTAVGVGLGNHTATSLEYVSVPQAGTVSFDYAFSDSLGGTTPGSANLTYSLDSNVASINLVSTGTVSWAVQPGDIITFTANAFGGNNMMQIGTGAGMIINTPAASSATATISNFSFSSVPEPADFALGAGLFSLGAVVYRRQRRN